MKIFLATIFACCSIIVFAQRPPLQWSLKATRLSDNNYQFAVTVNIASGWFIYAGDKSHDELTGPTLNWDHELLHPEGGLLFNGSPVEIADDIFQRQVKVFRSGFTFLQKIRSIGTPPAKLKLHITAFASNGQEFLPLEFSQEVELEGGFSVTRNIQIASVSLAHPVSTCGDARKESGSLFTIFLLGLAGGFLALLTPCVFPMIPVTISFFTNRSQARTGAATGLLYGGFIFFIYTVASLPFHLLGSISPEIFNSISTNAWVNIFFFLVFLVFALSLFGLFEIQLPSRFLNSANSKSGIHNISGIFFMALTLAVVSFSCTGPILGSLLVGSVSSANGAWQLTAGMAGFGLALGLPFALFAMFPKWLGKIPKGGGWMETVKKTLAFVELALAIKFLSNADLVEHWGILKREVFIGLWVLIAIGLSLYLLGTFRKRNYVHPLLAHDGMQRKPTPWLSRFLGLVIMLFACYMVPGITPSNYANLSLLSGFPPPLSYSIYGKDNVDGKGLEPDVINDYDKAIALAKKYNKPLLIDFTGWACVNCRKMEEQIWTAPEISSIIKEKFVLLSLYVDDRKKLPATERFTWKDTITGTDKDIVTIGDKYATMQAANFKQVTQPMYVILSSDEKLLNNPVGYTANTNEYRRWLECGLDASKKQQGN